MSAHTTSQTASWARVAKLPRTLLLALSESGRAIKLGKVATSSLHRLFSHCSLLGCTGNHIGHASYCSPPTPTHTSTHLRPPTPSRSVACSLSYPMLIVPVVFLLMQCGHAPVCYRKARAQVARRHQPEPLAELLSSRSGKSPDPARARIGYLGKDTPHKGPKQPRLPHL